MLKRPYTFPIFLAAREWDWTVRHIPSPTRNFLLKARNLFWQQQRVQHWQQSQWPRLVTGVWAEAQRSLHQTSCLMSLWLRFSKDSLEACFLKPDKSVTSQYPFLKCVVYTTASVFYFVLLRTLTVVLKVVSEAYKKVYLPPGAPGSWGWLEVTGSNSHPKEKEEGSITERKNNSWGYGNRRRKLTNLQRFSKLIESLSSPIKTLFLIIIIKRTITDNRTWVK